MKKQIATIITALLLGSAASALAADIYGLKSKSLSSWGPDQYENPVYLYHYDDAAVGLQPTYVGTVRTEGGTELRADGLAYDPAAGMCFFEPSFNTAVESTLRPLNMLNAVAGEGVVFTGRHVFAAAFDADGRLWALDQENDELLRIDHDSGTIVESTGLMRDGNVFDLDFFGGDIAFDAAGQAWITYFDTFYQVDLPTGVMTPVHTNSSLSLWMVGAAFSRTDPSHLHIFDVSIAWNNDDLLRFDVDDAFSRTDVALRIFDSAFNAGRGDLAVVELDDPPSLSIAGGSNVVVSWPQRPEDWRLYETPALGTGTVSWSEIAPPYANDAARLFYPVDDPAGNSFYQLQLP